MDNEALSAIFQNVGLIWETEMWSEALIVIVSSQVMGIVMMRAIKKYATLITETEDLSRSITQMTQLFSTKEENWLMVTMRKILFMSM